ncbi:MAG: histidine phosphatase family protein [Pseudomonadota bacterium]
MRRLILFRHAKAESRVAEGGDAERPLADRGRSDAALVARRLADAGLAPDLALVSCARRARETWDLAAPAFPKARVEIRDDLYNADADEILAELDGKAEAAETVMVVGHNPSLQELAVTLLIEGGAPPGDIERVSAGFPTATAAALAIDPAGRAALDGLFHARDGREEEG